MNNNKTTLITKKGMSTLARAKFAPGMLLQHEDLQQLNYYTRDLSRLLFRSFFGCGVICGLVVKTARKCGKLEITVEAGVALACGDPIEVPNDVSILLDQECHPGFGKKLWVVLCGTVKCCAPRASMCETDDDETKSECTRERDGYEIRIVSERPPCICGCPEPEENAPPEQEREPPDHGLAVNVVNPPEVIDCKCVNPDSPCYKDHYDGLCGCHCDDCSDCECKCVLLARLDQVGDTADWKADHSVRRFIRPVLMRDQQVEKDKAALAYAAGATDPQTTPLFEQLSGQHSEKEMMRIRETWTSFSADERAQVRNILNQYPEQEQAPKLREILNKYHDAKLAPDIPLQNRNLTSKLAADLAQARKRSRRLPQSRRTSNPE